MGNGHYFFPRPMNEPVFGYAPGSPERTALKKQLAMCKANPLEIPMYIHGKEVNTGNLVTLHPPHEHQGILGQFHRGGIKEVDLAIQAALAARKSWGGLSWENRAGIFLKAAELMSGKYRFQLNATTMLGQSKNVYQAEIDSACELIDFLRFNVHFLSEIYAQQPWPSTGVNNRLEYRPLEGFVLAVTPFNFTAISGNLPTSAAMCGNVVVWKPANSQVYAAQLIMRILIEAGLPEGVINLVYADGQTIGNACFSHPDFSGIHFTGSTTVFQNMWKTIGNNIQNYKSYPRIVGETGGKDFVLVHPSADPDAVVANLIRGAFEFQGQKCSAASRAYLPSNLAGTIKQKMMDEMSTLKMGSPEDFSNFINAVIDEKSFDRIRGYIEDAGLRSSVKIITGGKCDKSTGYYIQPTLMETSDPHDVTMQEEIFGPVLTLYVYDEKKFDETLDLVDSSSPYALTGSVFSADRQAIELATRKLVNCAGNFYINDKPTGAVVGQQPFGGARASGTNDKAGSMINLYRWLSARTIKETFVPVTDYRYAFHKES